MTEAQHGIEGGVTAGGYGSILCVVSFSAKTKDLQMFVSIDGSTFVQVVVSCQVAHKQRCVSRPQTVTPIGGRMHGTLALESSTHQTPEADTLHTVLPHKLPPHQVHPSLPPSITSMPPNTLSCVHRRMPGAWPQPPWQLARAPLRVLSRVCRAPLHHRHNHSHPMASASRPAGCCSPTTSASLLGCVTRVCCCRRPPWQALPLAA